MKKHPLFILFLFLSTSLYSQSNNSLYKGMVVDKNNVPLDVFSIVIFNAKDTVNQVFADTFTSGKFDIRFIPVKGDKYGVYLLSMGYKDMRIDLQKLTDTIVMPATSMILDDVVVEGKRAVSTTLGTSGGVLFDVSNTYLSDLGNSTDLLNFIPGVQAGRDGDVKLVGVQGDVVIYVNNIKIKDTQKLKAYKSEDISSVEVLRSPGAKYKNAAAVILIKTNKEYEGFSSFIEIESFLKANKTYSVVPSLQASYTKDKIVASVAYKLDRDVSEEQRTGSKVIDEYISPENWTFSDTGFKDNDIYNHWYNANIDYNINEKNQVTFQYSGRNNINRGNGSTSQALSALSLGNILDNKYLLNNSVSRTDNTGHVYYRGTYSPKFNLEYNADFTNRVDDNDNFNTWQISSAKPQKFRQRTQSKAYAFTTDILLTNKIKQKHTLCYGLEYSYLQDHVISNTKEEQVTDYKQNSTFIKTILEYKVQLMPLLSLSLGFNYLYNYVTDNNTFDKGKNYNSLIPYMGIQYYNVKKGYGMSLNMKYNNFQPNAGMLDDVTVYYISPYEVTTGNKDLKNIKTTDVSFTINYKQFFSYLIYQNATNAIFDLPTVKIEGDNTPLITTKPINLTNPVNAVGLYMGYSNKLKFWTHSFQIGAMYSHTLIPNGNGVDVTNQGVYGMVSMNNNFDLPKKFFINLSGQYSPKGYMLYQTQGQIYTVKLNLEKRMLKDQLRITILSKFSNDWNFTSSSLNGLYRDNRNYSSWYKFIGISVSWRFNNHKEIQKAKESAYMNML